MSLHHRKENRCEGSQSKNRSQGKGSGGRRDGGRQHPVLLCSSLSSVKQPRGGGASNSLEVLTPSQYIQERRVILCLLALPHDAEASAGHSDSCTGQKWMNEWMELLCAICKLDWQDIGMGASRVSGHWAWLKPPIMYFLNMGFLENRADLSVPASLIPLQWWPSVYIMFCFSWHCTVLV